jgi:hypothetical protein
MTRCHLKIRAFLASERGDYLKNSGILQFLKNTSNLKFFGHYFPPRLFKFCLLRLNKINCIKYGFIVFCKIN